MLSRAAWRSARRIFTLKPAFRRSASLIPHEKYPMCGIPVGAVPM